MIVVPDAGPLIYLGGANELELLRKLYDEVVVPRVVHDEVVVAGAGLPGAREVAACRWIRVESSHKDTGCKVPRGAGTFLSAPTFLGGRAEVAEVTFAEQVDLPASAQVGQGFEGPWKSL